MRTQLILTTAVLGLASLGASAQVYSVNAVGYINLSVPAGNKLVLVANQLKNGDNKLATVVPTAAEGTLVYTYAQASGFTTTGFEFGAWGPGNPTIAPGVGFFVSSPTAATITLVGEVPQGDLKTDLLQGLNLVSSQVPQAGKLQADLKYTPAEGDIVYQWDSAAQGYKAANGFEFGSWSSGDPAIAVGEGFFLAKAAAGSWSRTFSVNQ
jgi:hypothetical protein